jgi:cytoskeletal protein CcmA (bactofilin family)
VDERMRADAATTIIGGGTSFNGVLKVNGCLRVDGEVEGQVAVTEGLVVGPTGVVKADVSADSAVITGRVYGSLRARGKVQLLRGSRLEGDVHSNSFQIEDGAVFQGNCLMGEVRRATDGARVAESPDALKIAKN